MRVDDLAIGEIYRIAPEEKLMKLFVVPAQYDDDRFLKFYATHSQDLDEMSNVRTPVDPSVIEPLLYIGTKPSRLHTHEPVEATHVFASPDATRFCVQGRWIKYILPFTVHPASL